MRFRFALFIVVVGLLSTLAVANAKSCHRSLSASHACSTLKARVGAHDGVAPAQLDKTWFCDITEDKEHGHPEWWVIGLRSFRQCDGICSNLRGWFAVNRSSGEVREWDVGAGKLGGPIGSP